MQALFWPWAPIGCRVERCMEWLTPIGVWREFVLRLSHIVSKCILKQSSFQLVSWKWTSLPWQPTWKTQRQAQGTALDPATRISHRFPEEGKLLLQHSWLFFIQNLHASESCLHTPCLIHLHPYILALRIAFPLSLSIY